MASCQNTKIVSAQASKYNVQFTETLGTVEHVKWHHESNQQNLAYTKLWFYYWSLKKYVSRGKFKKREMGNFRVKDT